MALTKAPLLKHDLHFHGLRHSPEGKRAKKKNRKTKQQGNRKKEGLEGQGKHRTISASPKVSHKRVFTLVR